jgi:hypothetical protein
LLIAVVYEYIDEAFESAFARQDAKNDQIA